VIVAKKLIDVASLVISVGKSCESRNLSKEDLAHLQTDLEPLQRWVCVHPKYALRLLSSGYDF